MQNSVTMGLRAIVLLICLVGVPLFAVFGKNAPEVVKALLRNYAVGPAENNSSDAAAGNDTSFRPGLVAAQGQPPRNLPSETADDTTRVPRPLVPVAELPPPGHAAQTGEARSQPASQVSNGAPPPVSGPVVRAVGAVINQRESAAAAALHLDTSRAVQAGPTVEKLARDSSAARNIVSGFPPDYFRGAEQKLRHLGATYYLLETLGPAGDNYRFFFKVAVSQDPDQLLAFFATNADPLAAMDDVVRQVEAWRAHLRQ